MRGGLFIGELYTDLCGDLNMKIGIVTFWWSNNNYGQQLQAYALSKYLELCSYEVELIAYSPIVTTDSWKRRILHSWKICNPKRFLWEYKRVVTAYRTKDQTSYVASMSKRFGEFRKKYLKFSEVPYHSLHELNDNPPDCDVYVCGSDQIWNYFRKGELGYEDIDVFSLNFGSEKTVRISYAASIGNSGIQDDHGKRLANNLERFRGVSVREEHAVGVLKQFTDIEVVWVPDPTMLIDASEYEKLIGNSSQRGDVDFFIYAMNAFGKDVTLRQIITQIQKRGKSFDCCGGNGLRDVHLNSFPSMQEWLGHMKDAQTIITNSFHGCVFSVLFKKNFYYYTLRPKKGGHVDTRIDSLLDRLGITGRKISSKQELTEIIANPCRSIDWASVKKNQNEFVQVGKDFLRKCLDLDK